MSTRSQQLGRPSRKSTGSRGSATAPQALLPWVPQMLVVYAVLAVIGLVLLIVGYAIVNNETVYTDQEPGITLAIGGVVIANLAGALLLLAGRRVITQRRVAVLGNVPTARIAETVVTGPAASTHLVGGEGLTHYHRADCPMAAGRAWPEMAAADHERAGRQACGVCRP